MRALNVLLAILVSVLIALGVLELGLRLMPAFATPPTLNRPDTVLGWSKEPGKSIVRRSPDGEKLHFDINEHGLRDDEGVGPGKEPNTFRVLMLGDSFVLGYTVERKDLFVDQLEGWWKSEDRRIDVVNAGTEGWSTDQEVAWFLENVEAYRPDLVLLFPYENDLYWNGQERYPNASGTPKPRFETSGVWEKKSLPPAPSKPLASRSATLRALGLLAARVGHTPPPFNPEFGVLLDTPPQGYDDWLARTENALRNLDLACDALRVKLLMVPIPSKSAVDPEERAFFEGWEYGMQGRKDWNPDRPVNAFLELGRKLGIDTLDPRASLAEATRAQGKLYFEKAAEWHFNARGNEVFATWLHEELDRREIFPPEHRARASGAIPPHGPAKQGGLPTWLLVFAGLWLFLGTAFCFTYPDEPKPRAYLGVGAMLGSVFLLVLGGGHLLEFVPLAWRTWLMLAILAGILGFVSYKLGRRLTTVLELLNAFTRRGHWYLMPLVVVLLTIGSLLVVAASSPLIAPFIYTLF